MCFLCSFASLAAVCHTSVCTMNGLWVRSVLTVWKRSISPSYLILSRTMLRVMNTPVRPTPALVDTYIIRLFILSTIRIQLDRIRVAPPCLAALIVSGWFLIVMSVFTHTRTSIHTHTQNYLQCTVIGPSCPNCSLVLCTFSMKSMIPSPVFGTPCSGQLLNWNCLMVLEWPS